MILFEAPLFGFGARIHSELFLYISDHAFEDSVHSVFSEVLVVPKDSVLSPVLSLPPS